MKTSGKVTTPRDGSTGGAGGFFVTVDLCQRRSPREVDGGQRGFFCVKKDL